MKNILLFALMLAIIPATSVVADPPGSNPPPGGWGTDMTNWQTPGGYYDTGWLIFRPGTGYVVKSTGELVVWEDLWVELWIEMETRYILSSTNLQVHRVSGYSDITWIINGQWWGNHPTYFFWDGDGGNKDLFTLEFINAVAGASTGDDITLTWRYSIDSGTWYDFYEMTWLHDWGFLLPSGHFSFDIEMVADLVDYQHDGYYLFDPLMVCSPGL